jgi:hypothetical protein
MSTRVVTGTDPQLAKVAVVSVEGRENDIRLKQHLLVNTHNIDRIGQNLIQALIHMTAAGEDVAHEAVDLLCEFVERLQAGLTSSNEYQAG